MVVSTESSTGPTKSKKKRPAGSSSKSRRSSTKEKQQEAYLYDQPRSIAEVHQVVNEEDHLYDVVRPRGADSTYQNVVADSRAIYQNMDDMWVVYFQSPYLFNSSLPIDSYV